MEATMRDLRGRVAVITGAASGIGRAMAETFAGEGMKVVLADVETGALARTAGDLERAGAEVVAVETDVSRAEAVEALARKALDTFGAVHVLCNNAGVAITELGVASWEHTLDDWNWVLGVNLMGVIHGIRAFVPIMLSQETEGSIVNTASMAGLIAGGEPVYGVTKHAVVALSESLHNELAARGARIKVSVLCPGWVATDILDGDRNRPAELSRMAKSGLPAEQRTIVRELVQKVLESGLDPRDVARRVLDSIREERFYILTHPDWKYMIEHRMSNILQDRDPTFLMAPGLEGAEALFPRNE
jgi:NAD(P)-dependent dehydrogenase (short-subunit alcohol dehydrogenase family)